MTDNCDWLNEFTKEEIIDWLKSKVFFYFDPPTKREFLYARWKIKEKEYSIKYGKLTEELNNIDIKKRDELAKLFNNEKNVDERFKILEKMKSYQDALKQYLEKSMKLEKEREEIDRLYESISGE